MHTLSCVWVYFSGLRILLHCFFFFFKKKSWPGLPKAAPVTLGQISSKHLISCDIRSMGLSTNPFTFQTEDNFFKCGLKQDKWNIKLILSTSTKIVKNNNKKKAIKKQSNCRWDYLGSFSTESFVGNSKDVFGFGELVKFFVIRQFWVLLLYVIYLEEKF